jgi:hypothetical protein
MILSAAFGFCRDEMTNFDGSRNGEFVSIDTYATKNIITQKEETELITKKGRGSYA